jgi:hypothetical protein
MNSMSKESIANTQDDGHLKDKSTSFITMNGDSIEGKQPQLKIISDE